MHINLYDEIGAYDLGSIFDQAIEDEPRLLQVSDDTNNTASYVIGRYFSRNLRDQVMVALAMGSRVVDISIHPLIAEPLALYLQNRDRVEFAGGSCQTTTVTLEDSVIECDLHNDPQVDPLCLVRELVKQADRPEDIPRALARLTLDRIWERLEALLSKGSNRIHMLVPANAADLSGSFRDAA